jgi:hypothetical protein
MWILAYPSSPSKDLETIREGRCWRPAGSMGQRSEDPVQHFIQALSNVFGEESKHEIAILLQQNILAPVATIRFGAGKMLIDWLAQKK